MACLAKESPREVVEKYIQAIELGDPERVVAGVRNTLTVLALRKDRVAEVAVEALEAVNLFHAVRLADLEDSHREDADARRKTAENAVKKVHEALMAGTEVTESLLVASALPLTQDPDVEKV